MVTITTRQRDLLKRLLDADAPMGASELAAQMRLTPRQVNYGLRGIEVWLKQREIKLEVTPGVGIEVKCSSEQNEILRQSLITSTHVQLILSADQRQQLLALILLVAEEPMILAELTRLAQVSRTTVSKDLDAIEDWIDEHHLRLIRRPNYGAFLEGTERHRQELIFKLLWGATPFGTPLTTIDHTNGLSFVLQEDANLLPLVERSNEIIKRWNVRRVLGIVADAEAQFGGRFTDDAVLYLALVLAVRTDRVSEGRHIGVDTDDISWLKKLPAWPIAKRITQRLGWKLMPEKRDASIASIAMDVLASPRNERWPGDLDVDRGFSGIISDVMEYIGDAYNLSDMVQDRTLHDGIVNQVVPACLRQRFQLWMPSPSQRTVLSGKYTVEQEVAQGIAQIIEHQSDVRLPEGEINNIALVLRAAYIRTRPYRLERVIVVCPSGMATAQLLVARLEARFPRLGPLEVISIRGLGGQELSTTDLVISTVPLPTDLISSVDMIQVHPLLLPEDIEKITKVLT